MRIMLFIVKITGFIPALLFLKPHVVGKRKLPAPCIVVSNHHSLMDFVLLLITFPFRTLRFLMAELLFNKGKLFATFLYAIGGIRVDRDALNFEFVSNALEVLDNGGTLGVFPEGRLPVGGKHYPFTVSTAFIALHCDAPVVPVYTDGNYGLFKRASMVIGEPIYLADYSQQGLTEEQQLEHLTNVLEKKVYALQEQLKKGTK